MRRTIRSLALMTAGLLIAAPAAAEGIPGWEGKWEGRLVNLPGKPGQPDVRIERETGPWPAAGSCTPLVTRYIVEGQKPMVKDYRLCRGAGPTDLYVDEGGGVTLSAHLLGDVLVSPFKYDDFLLVASTRVDGDRMVEEILSARDQPAIKGIVKLQATSLQRLTFQRRP
jgi:hypothetical protein